ncbi:YfiR family protein [bacterium]|nr:YfiR family protein [bacterium]
MLKGTYQTFMIRIKIFLTVVLLLNTVCLYGKNPAPNQPSEYEIKAAFIYNFAKFVEWPAFSKQVEMDSLVIGILGHDPFGYILEKVIGGKTVGGKTLLIRRYSRVDQVSDCHVVFISDSENQKLRSILNVLNSKNILTVSEMDQFAQHGGMIQMYMENKRIRFAVNIDAVENAELKLSSKILNLADIVRNSD